jgi:hypothetical protein
VSAGDSIKTQYKGVFLFLEHIEVGLHHVNIAKANNLTNDTGYIIAQDKSKQHDIIVHSGRRNKKKSQVKNLSFCFLSGCGIKVLKYPTHPTDGHIGK